MRYLTQAILKVADRVFPMFAIFGLLFSVEYLGSAENSREVFWGLCCLGLSCVAMWAFWGEDSGVKTEQ